MCKKSLAIENRSYTGKLRLVLLYQLVQVGWVCVTWLKPPSSKVGMIPLFRFQERELKYANRMLLGLYFPAIGW